MLFVLLGAEGCAELQGSDWLREATPSEIQDFQRRQRISALDFAALSLDAIGRPYFLVVVLDHAPEAVQVRARASLRLLRLVP